MPKPASRSVARGPGSGGGPRRKGDTTISDIIFLLENLERLLGESWRIPISNYVVVSEDDILDLVDQMRTAIPKEIKQAELVLRERDRRMAQAEEEAGRIVQMAHGEAQKLAEEHEVVHAANQRAQTILERAQREAQTLKEEADEYARGVLLDLNEQLGALNDQINRVLTTVHNGLLELSAQGQADTE